MSPVAVSARVRASVHYSTLCIGTRDTVKESREGISWVVDALKGPGIMS